MALIDNASSAGSADADESTPGCLFLTPQGASGDPRVSNVCSGVSSWIKVPPETCAAVAQALAGEAYMPLAVFACIPDADFSQVAMGLWMAEP